MTDLIEPTAQPVSPADKWLSWPISLGFSTENFTEMVGVMKELKETLQQVSLTEADRTFLLEVAGVLKKSGHLQDAKTMIQLVGRLSP